MANKSQGGCEQKMYLAKLRGGGLKLNRFDRYYLCFILNRTLAEKVFYGL